MLYACLIFPHLGVKCGTARLEALHFNSHFTRCTWVSRYWKCLHPKFIGAKDDGGGDNWRYKTCKAPVKSSPPTDQHPVFTDRLPFLRERKPPRGPNSFESFNLRSASLQNRMISSMALVLLFYRILWKLVEKFVLTDRHHNLLMEIMMQYGLLWRAMKILCTRLRAVCEPKDTESCHYLHRFPRFSGSRSSHLEHATSARHLFLVVDCI